MGYISIVDYAESLPRSPDMLLVINNVDVTGLIAPDGYEITRYSVDGSNAGETMDGTMIREWIGDKEKGQFTCRPLTDQECRALLTLLHNEFVTVSWISPYEGLRENLTMYSNNIPAKFLIKDAYGRLRWDGIKFPLIERSVHM